MAHVAELCDALGIQLKVEKPRDTYMYRLGERCADAKLVVCSWPHTVMDTNGYPTTLIFDMVKGRSPLIVGKDIKQYSDTCNMKTQRTITYRRPNDEISYTLHTHIQ